jgi:hypothetical protein
LIERVLNLIDRHLSGPDGNTRIFYSYLNYEP